MEGAGCVGITSYAAIDEYTDNGDIVNMVSVPTDG
jgi:hypothetical protein